MNPDYENIGWSLLSFFFLPIGFILWLIWRKEYPNRCKSLTRGFKWYGIYYVFCLNFALLIWMIVFPIALIGAML